MIPERAFAGLLQLDDRWAVLAAEYETEPQERFLVVVRETEKLWPSLRCPEPKCGGDRVERRADRPSGIVERNPYPPSTHISGIIKRPSLQKYKKSVSQCLSYFSFKN